MSCFRRVHVDDKALASEPLRRLMAWCPTMDLLALVVGENMVAVHRLSWARLLTFEHTSSVSALCWSPDGRTLAVGFDDGRLTLYDVESGDAISSSQVSVDVLRFRHLWSLSNEGARVLPNEGALEIDILTGCLVCDASGSIC